MRCRRLMPMMTLLCLTAVTACKEDDRLGVMGGVDPTNMPQLSTTNVSTLISDSGYTKYKVVTPLWNVYGGDGKEPYWLFPKGVYLRQFDHDLQVTSTVAADSACYFPNKKLWELFGDVEIDQKGHSYFYSPRIFFDDREKRIYSDTFIHIKTPTQTLEGIGFESNQELTRYRVLRPKGMFPAKFGEGGPTMGPAPGLMMPSIAPVDEPAPDPMPEERVATEPETATAPQEP